MEHISIHAPHARSDAHRKIVSIDYLHFNPRSSCEERHLNNGNRLVSTYFNPRSSCEERRYRAEDISGYRKFQSTLLMRGATWQFKNRGDTRYFNPRSSCEERRLSALYDLQPAYFNPRSSCEERHDVLCAAIVVLAISIHAPHARSDISSRRMHQRRRQFQSTLLMRGATRHTAFVNLFKVISIHAPHARSDGSLGRRRRCNRISIHAPHARSDADTREQFRHDNISIHAPHARSDMPFALSDSPFSLFQSTLLMRGATSAAIRARTSRAHFNPRSSCEERRHASKQT